MARACCKRLRDASGRAGAIVGLRVRQRCRRRGFGSYRGRPKGQKTEGGPERLNTHKSRCQVVTITHLKCNGNNLTPRAAKATPTAGLVARRAPSGCAVGYAAACTGRSSTGARTLRPPPHAGALRADYGGRLRQLPGLSPGAHPAGAPLAARRPRPPPHAGALRADYGGRLRQLPGLSPGAHPAGAPLAARRPTQVGVLRALERCGRPLTPALCAPTTGAGYANCRACRPARTQRVRRWLRGGLHR